MSLGYFIDIQGTLLSDEDKSPIIGSLELLEFFNKTSTPYILVTNNTKQKSLELIEELHVKGFDFPKESFIDPLMVLKDKVGDKSVLGFGSQKFCDILPKLDLHVSKNPDIILIASDDNFSSQDFASMIELVLGGAKPIGMHGTSTYAKHGRRYPGVGAILAMIEYATGVKGEVVGKPSEVFYKSAFEMLKKQSPTLRLQDICMISDDALGDLVGAKDIGIKTSLVLSGKCKSENEILHVKDKIDNVSSNVNEILQSLK